MINSLNLVVELAGIVLCALGILQVRVGARVDKRTERYFILFYVTLTLFALSNMLGVILRGRPGQNWRAALYVTNFLEFTMPSFLAYIMSRYLLSIVDPGHERKAMRSVMAGLLILHIVMLTVSQFTGLYYVIDESNVYRRSPGYPISYIMSAVILGLDGYLLVHERKRLTHNQRTAFCIYFIIPTIAMGMQLFIYGSNLVIFASILAALAMYVFIVDDQTERYYRQIEENTRLRVEILLSQIQPHFLFNSLGAIQHLCKNDPEAREAISKFSRYLRGNMDAIAQDEPIPFTTELGHTEIYLELEQLRFDDELSVVYDLECTEFLLPTLTLQPLVENAVRYGVRGTEDGRGEVTISTREYDDRYEVSVADNGPGFDPEAVKHDGRSHIGLPNVRERLRRVSGGSLRIESAAGQGTTATIVLPKEGKKHDSIRRR